MSVTRKDKYSKGVFIVLVFLLGLFSCSKDDDPVIADEEKTPFTLRQPTFFPKAVESAVDPKTGLPSNPLTKAGVELGRRLFFDPILSANKQVSCGSCHHQGKAFSDGLAITTAGVSGKPLERHSPTLINLAWTDKGFFWDGGSTNLESQAFGPLTHVDEMGMYLPVLVERLLADATYVELFLKAFGELPSEHRTAMALSQFQRILVSADTPYDLYRRGEQPDALSADQLRGLSLVRQKCGSCHAGELFTDNSFHNNGIDDDFGDGSHEGIYWGRYRITYNPLDLGAFKTPTLRNVMVSAPYMHDGRFKTIDEVLNHYRFGIKDTPVTVAVLYQNGEQVGIPMTDREAEDIKAFLNALTDDKFLNNREFSNPFN
ncbi:cytochrome-c peroxidase [Sphingobacterium phlebotomi]|uniref:Cytochrome-c peroxidase n=1 Tax=Sphingobacterium phlebotomi TaxID=2605433 RepID=A0A5D4GUB0_9SPHI|nr:cytochrome c peroxidase [Sphingobacterium phlebotomi]TYR31704.1 cytochrome-c peroxidase [Sphingobacterium phlebotomi]